MVDILARSLVDKLNSRFHPNIYKGHTGDYIFQNILREFAHYPNKVQPFHRYGYL